MLIWTLHLTLRTQFCQQIHKYSGSLIVQNFPVSVKKYGTDSGKLCIL